MENDLYFRKPVSNTFHGRDIFAPVAARLGKGIIMDTLGAKLSDYVRLDWPQPTLSSSAARGEIIYIDHFGNAITNIEAVTLPQVAGRPLWVALRGEEICVVRRFYQDEPASKPVAVPGSTGFLEIAINGGNAAQKFAIKIGDPVEVH